MLKICKLSWSNMFCYGEDNHIDLASNSKVIQLHGENGSGKSSVATILEELLYNKNSLGYKKAEILNDSDDIKTYSGTVELVKDGVQYVLSKSVTGSKTSVTLTKDGEDISGHTATQTYKVVESIIGLDFKTFTKLINQNIESGLDFLEATDSNRRKFLISFLDLDKYTEVGTKVKERLTEIKAQLRAQQSVIDTYKHNLDSIVLVDKSDIPDLVKVPEDPEDLRTSIAESTATLSNIDGTNASIKSAKAKQQKFEKLVESVTPVDEPRKFDRSELDTVTAKLQITKNELVSTENEVRYLSNSPTECKQCKRPFDEESIQNVKDMLLVAKTSANTLKESCKLLRERKLELGELFDASISEANEYTKYLQDKASVDAARDNLDRSLSEKSLLDAGSLVEDIKELKSNLKQLLSQINSAKEHNDRVKRDIQESDAAQDAYDRCSESLEASKNELICISDEFTDMEIIAKAFGPKGLITYKIESSIKILEEAINDYLLPLSRGKFNLVFAITDAKLQVVIYRDGTEKAFQTLSSGQKCRVRLATLLAIRKLMSALSKTHINLVFLDEVISTLDVSGYEDLIDLLLTEELNTIAVSHNNDHPLAESKTIISENGFSRIIDGRL